MKLAKFCLLPLSLSILSPLSSEQFGEGSDFQYEDEREIAILDEEQVFDQEEMAAPEKTSPVKQQIASPSIVQQQGKSSTYDRNVLRQNHPAAQRKIASQNAAAPKQQSPRAKPASRTKPIAQSAEQMSPSTPQANGASSQKPTNMSARPPLTNGLNLWVLGEALLWQANEENLTYAYEQEGSSSFNEIKNLDFDWDWGFRVALGYNAPRDGWDFSLMWTHIHNHAEDSVENDIDDQELIMPVWNINNVGVGNLMDKAKARWNVHLEQVDLGLGKEYYVGKHLTLRPNGGLRADWIYQDYDVTYVPTGFTAFPQRIEMTNRFFGFGFFAGLDTDWMLGQGFSLYGMADFALLLGFFDVDQKVRQTNPNTGTPQQGNIDSSLRTGKGILDLNLGFKWSHLYTKNSWRLTFKAGYEYHVYFDQNQFSLMANNQKYFKPDGDLTYQGLTLSGQIDF